MHGIHYKAGHNLAGFTLTEKLDGLRIESRHGKPWSKQGQPLRLPDHLRQALIALPDLDAELYAGRNTRAALAGSCQSLRPDIQWPDSVGLFVFDSAESLPTVLPAGVGLVPAFGIAESTGAVLHLASAIISAGGEGIMARAPSLPWQSGRVSGLVKVKARALREMNVMIP